MVLTNEEKLQKIAQLIVERSLNVKKGEQVTIRTWEHTLDAASDFYYAVRKKGANPLILLNDEDAYFKSMKDFDTDILKVDDDYSPAIAKVENVNIFFSGPKDPRKFQTVPYEKMAAVEDNELNDKIDKIQKERNVRNAFVNIGQATPERAQAYGIIYEPWKEAMLDALLVDPEKMASIANPVIELIKNGKTGILYSKNGDKLEFKLAKRHPILDDGVLRPEDVKKGDTFVHLPSGVIFTAQLEGSSEGKISYDIALPSRGKLIKDVWVEVKKGRLVGYGASENDDELKGLVSSQLEKNMDLGYFTIGVNPAAQPYFIDHQMAQGVVGFHFGNNSTFGGKIKDKKYHFTSFSQFGTLEIDRKTIVDKGKIMV